MNKLQPLEEFAAKYYSPLFASLQASDIGMRCGPRVYLNKTEIQERKAT